MCFDFWGKKSGPYIQALHFCLSLGLLTGPLLVEPLSQTRLEQNSKMLKIILKAFQNELKPIFIVFLQGIKTT